MLAARAAGADVRERCEVTGVTWRGGRASGVRYRDVDGADHHIEARLVIGADGRRSTVAAEVGAFVPYRGSRNGRGLVFRYMDDPLASTVAGETIYQWRDGTSLGFAFPSAPRGRILALFMAASDEASWARADPDGYWKTKLGEHPAMAARLAGATNATRLRSTGETSAFFRASSGPGWALIGDAGHFKDPVIGQGQRDALWAARTLVEAVTHGLDDPGTTDLALRRWERDRDRECMPAYHFGNMETVVRPVSPVLIEILRRASADVAPDVSDLFGRARTLPQIVTLPRLAGGLAGAVARHGPGPHLISEAFADLRVHLGVRTEIRGRSFRSTRHLPGSEHPDPRPPALPRAARATASTPEAVPA